MQIEPRCHSGYLYSALTNPNEIIEWICSEIKKHQVEFDTVVFQGMSGALIAPALSIKLRKQLLMIRKTCDNNHSGLKYEGNVNVNNYIIVDDLICSGNTIDRMLTLLSDDVSKQCKRSSALKLIGEPLCQRIFLYRSDDDRKASRLFRGRVIPISSTLFQSDEGH